MQIVSCALWTVYPNMTVKELLYWIECRIEGEKFVISSYRWSVQMLQEHTTIGTIWSGYNTLFGMRG